MKATIDNQRPKAVASALQEGHWYWIEDSTMDLYLCVRVDADHWTLVSASEGSRWVNPCSSLETLRLSAVRDGASITPAVVKISAQ